MQKYPLRKELKIAIERLFENPETGFIALGIGGFPDSAKEKSLDSNIPHSDRVRMLKKRFEEWVELYARELEEFDSEYDIVRLRSEARAILMALREVFHHFPEVFHQIG